MDVIEIRLGILSAAMEYAQAQYALGRLGNVPMKDPAHVKASNEVQAKFKSLHTAISQIGEN